MFASLARPRLAALLLAAVTVLPFLSPFHYLPLPQWWGEIAVVVLAALACLCLPQGTLRLPRVVPWLALLALLWLSQPWFVDLLFPGLNAATALAFLALALLALAVVHWQALSDAETVMTVLAKGLLVGALLQSLIGLAQLTGLAPLLGGVLFYDAAHPTSNIFGHIGQRNQYAHYLSWGLVAVSWLAVARVLSRGVAVAVLLWLALSIAFAGSRTVLLYAAALLLLAPAWYWHVRDEASKRLMQWLLLAAGLLLLMQFALPLGEWLLRPLLHGELVASGVERLAANSDGMGARRLAEWGKAWLVFREAPWFGAGWSQYAYHSVRLQLLPQFVDSGVNSGLFSNAHNLVFQLLAEVGLIGTLAVLLGLLWVLLPWCGRQARAVHLLPLAMLAISLLHSMLEYPLWYLYFPAVLVMLLALAPVAEGGKRRPFRPVQYGALLMLLLAVYGSYRYVEMQGLYNPRTVQQQQRLQQIMREEPLFAFHALGLLDDVVRPGRDSPPQQRQWIALLAQMRPYPDVLRKEAQFLALEGRPQEAAYTMRLALASFPTYAPFFLRALSPEEPAWQPLRQQVEAAMLKP